MVRFYSSIYSDDKMLIRQMSLDGAFHAIPPQIAAAHRTKTECLGSVPLAFESKLIRGCNRLIWRSVVTFEAAVARTLRRHGSIAYLILGRQNLLDTNLI